MSDSEYEPGPVFVNGKFTAQAMSGVQRVATSLVRALDDLAKPGEWVLVCPPGSTVAPLRNIEIRTVGPIGLPLAVWEQLILPWVARRGRLISLAGSAPALAKHCSVFIHDAAVFECPQAYRASFVAWYRLLFRWFAFRGVSIATPSAFSQAALAKALGIDKTRITIIPCGCDHFESIKPNPEIARKHGLEPGRYLLAVGHANPGKNLAALLDAFKVSKANSLKLVIVGEQNIGVFRRMKSPDTGYLSKRQARPPLDSSRRYVGCPDQPQMKQADLIIYAGIVDDEELLHLYRQAMMLVFPSTYEGFGLPPLEAMSQGCPVVAIKRHPMLEILGDAACYAESAAPQDIAKAISKLAFDAPLRNMYSVSGRSHANHFRWSESAKRLVYFVRPEAPEASSRV